MGMRSTSLKMKQSYSSSSLRASRNPTLSSLARLKVSSPNCGAELSDARLPTLAPPTPCPWPPHLVDDVDAVSHLLPAQDGVQVVQPVLEMVFTVSEGDEDGHLLPGQAVWGGVLATLAHIGVLPLHPLHAHGRAELDEQAPNCKREGRVTPAEQDTVRVMVTHCSWPGQ